MEDGDLLNSVLRIQEEATEAMVKLTCMPKVNITWHLALAGNWTPVAKFASHHHTTDPFNAIECNLTNTPL